MGTAFAIVILWSASPGNIEGLIGAPSTTYVAPDRMFSVNLPSSWKVLEPKNKNEFQFVVSGSGNPLMYIRRLIVPEGADPIQIALRAIDERLSKMPRFVLKSKRRVTLAGHKAAMISGTYAFQGNIQYPRAIEEVYVVVGAEAFVFHFDVFEAVAAQYVDQLNSFYQSFVPRPTQSVFDTDAQTPNEVLPEPEKVPF